MKLTLLQLIEGILGVGEQIIPLFIHNPKSQQIEGIVVGTLSGLMSGLTPTATTTPTT